MSEIHDYDKHRWEGERSALVEAQELLCSTEVSEALINEVRKHIVELDEYLKYGANEEGTGPDNEWRYTNGEVNKETHPEPGIEGISMYLCDTCGCSLEITERPHFNSADGGLMCNECFTHR